MMNRWLEDKRNLVIILLGSLSLIAVVQEGLAFLFWVLAGVLLSVTFDFLFSRVIFKKSSFSKSALITGFILAGIIDYGQPYWILAAFSFLAIFSKYLIKHKNKHIFNPANFSLFLATVFKIPLTWHIESNIYLIAILGIYLAYVFRKIPQILGFIIFSAGLFILAKINIFSLLGLFFVFVMLIEPKTSGFGILRGFVFGAIAGTVSFLSFKFFPGYDFLVTSLFVANMFNPILKKMPDRLTGGGYGA